MVFRNLRRGLPAGDQWDGSDPPRGCCANVNWRNAAVPDPGTKKGGSLPSTSDFPVLAPPFVDLGVTTSRNGRSGNSPV